MKTHFLHQPIRRRPAKGWKRLSTLGRDLRDAGRGNPFHASS